MSDVLKYFYFMFMWNITSSTHWIFTDSFLNALTVKLSVGAAVISLFAALCQAVSGTMIGGRGLMNFDPLSELSSAVYSSRLSKFVGVSVVFLILFLESSTLVFAI